MNSATNSDTPAPPSPHLAIAFASCSADAWRPTMQALPDSALKNLGKLLQGMKRVATDTGEAHSLSTPHERVLARAQGLIDLRVAPSPAGGRPGMGAASHGHGAGPHPNPLPAGEGVIQDGLIPWAAWEAGETEGKAWAFITPCHWAMGREHATLTDPAALGLTPEESRTLLAAMQPYFETEGITLHYAAPERWLAEGELFRQLPSASLDRVLGRNVDAWLPGAKTGDGRRAGPPQASPAPTNHERGSVPPKAREATSVGARTLRLLQNEMQMLLYTHPLNDARSSRRQLTVNSFWLSGSGALARPWQAPASASSVARSLAQAVFSADWGAYAQAWQALDKGEIAGCLARQGAGQVLRLSLCGESTAQTFETSGAGLLARITGIFSPQRALAVLEQL